MLLDAKLAFIASGASLSLVGATGATFTAPNVIDLMGPGVGQAMASFAGNAAVPGQADAMGVGMLRPELVVHIGTALVTAGSATLTPALQYAPDNGANSPGTWQTIVQGPAITAAQGVANRRIFRCPWLPPFPFNLRPRFIQMIFLTPAGQQFSAGTISVATVTVTPDDPFMLQAAKNFTVSQLF